MKIPTLFGKGKTVLSFEIFPPKHGGSLTNIRETIALLAELSPDFISVTFGAGGNSADNTTFNVAEILKNEYKIEPVVHLTCINSTKEEITGILHRLKELEIENILALRGDKQDGIEPKTDFTYASDLVRFIRENGDFSVSAACYPEKHIDSPSLTDDILNLKKKVDAGASHLISQLFFDNNYFYDFVEKTKLAGINVPIEAGIMPVVNKRQIERIITLCGATLPRKFQRILAKYEDNDEALCDAGIAYAIDQIVDLLANGVDGIHLYTMNNPEIVSGIVKGISRIL